MHAHPREEIEWGSTAARARGEGRSRHARVGKPHRTVTFGASCLRHTHSIRQRKHSLRRSESWSPWSLFLELDNVTRMKETSYSKLRKALDQARAQHASDEDIINLLVEKALEVPGGVEALK